MTSDKEETNVPRVHMYPAKKPNPVPGVTSPNELSEQLGSSILDNPVLDSLDAAISDLVKQQNIFDDRLKKLEASLDQLNGAVCRLRMTPKAIESPPAADNLFSGRKPSIREAIEKSAKKLTGALIASENSTTMLRLVSKALLDAFDLGRGVRLVESSSRPNWSHEGD